MDLFRMTAVSIIQDLIRHWYKIWLLSVVMIKGRFHSTVRRLEKKNWGLGTPHFY